MYFVVAIDLDIDTTDYKVFEQYKDAKDRYYAAYGRVLNGRSTITKTGEKVLIEAARLYKAEATTPLGARELVEKGEGELLEDTEAPIDLDLDI